MKNNYAISTLGRFNDVAADVASTEGADIVAGDLNGDFYAGLGFKYGNNAENPWNDATATDPALHHETALMALSKEYNEIEGNTFDAELLIVTREAIDLDAFISDFICNISDESVVAMTGNGTVADNKAIIEFEALKQGQTAVTCSWRGSEVALNVKVAAKPSGIAGVDESVFALTLADGFVKAPGAQITLYSLQGARVATARDAVSIADLESGVYVAIARDADGNTARLKFVK